MTLATKDRTQRYLKLCREIDRHDRLYYKEFAPEISDQAYDDLMRELKAMEAGDPSLVAPFSPTQRVGSPLAEGEGFEKVGHEVPLLSLSNTYNIGEVDKFIQRMVKGLSGEGEGVQLVVEPKYDGISIELIYENGVFTRAVTRGDGVTGDDITANVRTVRDLPMLLPPPFPSRLVVRGEIYMTFENFEQLNVGREATGEALFMNPRNAAGGSLHLKDPRETASRNLRCFVYDILSSHAQYPTHLSVLSALKNMGFSLEASPDVVDAGTPYVETLSSLVALWDEKRLTLPYPVDGLVFKVNSLAQREILGTNVKDPRWGFAFKFAADRLPTRLLTVEFQVGRTGAVTPVAILDPVLLDGSRVSRASLHNFEFMENLNLEINDVVLVEKAAEIIPQVVSVEAKSAASRPIDVPRECPVCGEPLIRKRLKPKRKTDSEGPLEKTWRCENPTCPAILEQTILHFVGRDNMNIDALGEKLVAQLAGRGLVTRPSDLFTLTLEQLMTLERMGEKLARKILAAIEASRKLPFARVLGGLGIPGVGRATARPLAEYFKDFDGLLAITQQNSDEQETALREIFGVGEILAHDVVEWILKDVSRAEIRRLKDLLALEVTATSGALTGLRFCVTGSLSLPRPELHRRIEEAGGEVATGVSKTLDYLVCGEKAGSKKKKAEVLGIKILSEAEFFTLLERPHPSGESSQEPSDQAPGSTPQDPSVDSPRVTGQLGLEL